MIILKKPAIIFILIIKTTQMLCNHTQQNIPFNKELPMHSVRANVLLWIAKNNKILLIRKNLQQGYNANCWGLVGGKLERYETLRSAATREAYEELGIQVEENQLHFIGIINELYTDGTLPIARVFFIFKVQSWQGEPYNHEPTEHSSINWFEVDQVPNPIIAIHAHAIDMVNNGILYREYCWPEKTF